MSVIVEGEEKRGPLAPQSRSASAGLAFVMHGLGSSKESVFVRAQTEVFLKNGFTTVRFDTTHAFGESEGDYADATSTGYYEDLEDIISWARTQSWYREPFWLSGSSLGGLCIALYAEKYPKKIKALALMAPVVSGRLRVEAYQKYEPEIFKKWQDTGWRSEESGSTHGLIKKLKYSYVKDLLDYDLLPVANKLTMPVFLVVGQYDTSIPPEQQQVLFDALPGPKEMYIIKGAPHSFREPAHLAEIKDLFDRWIKKCQQSVIPA